MEVRRGSNRSVDLQELTYWNVFMLLCTCKTFLSKTLGSRSYNWSVFSVLKNPAKISLSLSHSLLPSLSLSNLLITLTCVLVSACLVCPHLPHLVPSLYIPLSQTLILSLSQLVVKLVECLLLCSCLMFLSVLLCVFFFFLVFCLFCQN